MVEFEPALEMNLVTIQKPTSSFPTSCVSLQTKGTGSPVQPPEIGETQSKRSVLRALSVLHAAILSHRYS